MTTATIYGDGYEPLKDPAYVAQLEREFLAYEERVSVTWVDEQVAAMQSGELCRECGAASIGKEWGVCARCYQIAQERAERQGGFDRPAAFDTHGGEA